MSAVGTTRPAQAWAAALAGLDGLGPVRLAELLGRYEPEQAWAVVRGRSAMPGRLRHVLGGDEGLDLLARQAAAVSVDEVWERCRSLGVWVEVFGHPGYPAVLADDPVPPVVLFGRGDVEVLDQRRVAVVGTRSATAAGRSVASQLGFQLAEAGVAVISGLARGIDGAVHHGATAAHQAGAPGRPIGVVAGGLDVVYPREHGSLYAEVARRGVLLSEQPPGTGLRPYRFPQRNRIVAALAEALVVVESRHRGGSLLTVEEANRRDVPVMAVPGAVSNPAAAGVNDLLRDGAHLVVDASDVLTLLSIGHHRVRRTGGNSGAPSPPSPTRHAELYLACLGSARTVEQLAVHLGSDLAVVAGAVHDLVAAGWLTDHGGWYEAADPT